MRSSPSQFKHRHCVSASEEAVPLVRCREICLNDVQSENGDSGRSGGSAQLFSDLTGFRLHFARKLHHVSGSFALRLRVPQNVLPVRGHRGKRLRPFPHGDMMLRRSLNLKGFLIFFQTLGAFCPSRSMQPRPALLLGPWLAGPRKEERPRRVPAPVGGSLPVPPPRSDAAAPRRSSARLAAFRFPSFRAW